MSKTGYVNGSDALLYIGSKAVGHCSSHTATFTSETKDRAVKPLASQNVGSGKWKRKGVVGLAIAVQTEGLRFYDETEFGYRDLLAAWKAGESVKLKLCERESSQTPYLQGNFIISSLEENAPAQDDATYKASFDNDGEPDILDETKITQNEPDLNAQGGNGGTQNVG